MDQTRGIQNGNFTKATTSTDVVESYGASGMPALMLMFPASDTATPIEEVAGEPLSAATSDVYTLDGRKVAQRVGVDQMANLDRGLYVYQRKKYLVK